MQVNYMGKNGCSNFHDFFSYLIDKKIIKKPPNIHINNFDKFGDKSISFYLKHGLTDFYGLTAIWSNG